MNINAKHFQGWTLRPGTKDRFPMIVFPKPAGLTYDRTIIINEPPGDMATHDEVARLLAHAPDLFRIADRFFAFYELHKAARGGQLGREYEELRAKIMGEVKP